MTNQPTNEEQTLLAATASTGSPGVPASDNIPEANELGAGYAALAKALKQQSATFQAIDLASFTERLKESLAEDELVSLPAAMQFESVRMAPDTIASVTIASMNITPPRPSSASNPAWYVIGGVVALLLAVGLYAFSDFANRSKTGLQPIASTDPVSPTPKTNPQQTSPKVAANSPSTKKHRSPGKTPLAQGKHPTSPVWKDPLDARIAKANTKVHRKIGPVATVYDSSLDRLDRKLGKMARELSRGTL